MSKRELTREIESESDIPGAIRWAEEMTRQGLRAGTVALFLGRPRRTLDQNAKLWPMLEDIAKQVEWVKDGERCRMPKEQWKDLFTASLRKQSMAPGIDGGMVVLGMHTSRMNKQTFTELLELMYAFGNPRGVRWSEPSKDVQREYGVGQAEVA